MAIKTWATGETRAIFEGKSPPIVPASVVRRAHRKLLILDAAKDLRDLRMSPGNRLEKLRGDRAGQYSIRINNQYRVCFIWRSGDAYRVEITDYHR
ncbi:type II toxin-antitoxin system RelE/ParE family toxin [Lentisalinibacter salinarum]|uniref:type II toxin-antitoxin system RelE/ParE family toxin n=1 Tax=Lentisalinibacter salinarum TaxID=2992239 RepID=UPI00386C8D4E